MHDWLVTQWNSVVRPRDLVWVLGDISFDHESLKVLDRLNGTKKMVWGNHDNLTQREYLKYFKKVVPYIKYKGFWLSHMPLDSHDINEGRVRGNIHGHLHQKTTGKPYHYNVCVEQCNGIPIRFDSIKEKHEKLSK